MDESTHELLDDLVLLYKDRKIHLTKDLVEGFIATARSKLKIERKPDSQQSQNWYSSEKGLPDSVESLETLKNSLDFRGVTNFRVTAALIDAYAKKRDFVSQFISLV